MNIENIVALGAQLQSLGFDSMGASLLKRICFKPESFVLSKRMLKGSDVFVFHLLFVNDRRSNGYSLQYYDAALQKEVVLPAIAEGGIDLIELEARMATINWKIAFDLDAIKPWSPAEKASWEAERNIESVVEILHELEKSAEGKHYATALKIKHWADMPGQEIAGAISSIKNKSELNQRFYLSEELAGISADEACRFLQNRWLEKQMLLRSKPTEIAEKDEVAPGDSNSSGSGLLKKKKNNTTKTGRKAGSVRNN